MWVYLALIVLYSTVPALLHYFALKKLYSGETESINNFILYFLIKLLTIVCFLPVLYFSDVDLGLKPVSLLSVGLLTLTFLLSLLGIIPAVKTQTFRFYSFGVSAAFMEEILYRGIIFGLAKAVWHNNLVALAVSSAAFGVWHLKNVPWLGKRRTILQFFYTAFIFGPIFGVERIWLGDLSLAIFHHYLTDTGVTLIPKRFRWIVVHRKDGIEKDSWQGVRV